MSYWTTEEKTYTSESPKKIWCISCPCLNTLMSVSEQSPFKRKKISRVLNSYKWKHEDPNLVKIKYNLCKFVKIVIINLCSWNRFTSGSLLFQFWWYFHLLIKLDAFRLSYYNSEFVARSCHLFYYKWVEREDTKCD